MGLKTPNKPSNKQKTWRTGEKVKLHETLRSDQLVLLKDAAAESTAKLSGALI